MNIKPLVFVLSLAINSLYAMAQKNSDNHKPTIAKTKILIGTAEQYEQLHKLQYVSACQAEFDQLPNSNVWVARRPKVVKGYFHIKTQNGKQQFKLYSDGDAEKSWNGYELLGYLPSMNFYALSENSSAEGISFSELFLLDGNNGTQYQIASFDDWRVSLPLPSRNNRYFVYYANMEYKHKNSDIGILSVNLKGAKGKVFKPYASIHSDEFAVEEIRWADDKTLYLKGYEEVYKNQKWIKKYKYYKISI